MHLWQSGILSVIGALHAAILYLPSIMLSYADWLGLPPTDADDHWAPIITQWLHGLIVATVGVDLKALLLIANYCAAA